MTVICPRCHFYGNKFSPEKAEKLTGLILDAKNEVGDIGKLGRYKGQPIPYGSASLSPSKKKIKSGLVEMWLLKNIKNNLTLMRSCGADKIWLDYGVFYDEQCNFEFSKEALLLIGSLNIDLLISCYQDRETIHGYSEL